MILLGETAAPGERDENFSVGHTDWDDTRPRMRERSSPDYRTTDARTSSLPASPVRLCIASRDRWIFPRFLCHRLSSPSPLHSSFYTDPSSGSYFVSNSSGWLFFVVKKKKRKEEKRRGEEEKRREEREREGEGGGDRYSIQGESSWNIREYFSQAWLDVRGRDRPISQPDRNQTLVVSQKSWMDENSWTLVRERRINIVPTK